MKPQVDGVTPDVRWHTGASGLTVNAWAQVPVPAVEQDFLLDLVPAAGLPAVIAWIAWTAFKAWVGWLPTVRVVVCAYQEAHRRGGG